MELTQVYHEADALTAADYQRVVEANQTANLTPERIGLDSGKRFSPAARATAATIRIHGAIGRGVFLDLMSNWTDLLDALGLVPVGTCYWPTMTTAVHAAMHHAEGPEAEKLWMHADECVRGYARVFAASKADEAMRLQGADDWADVDPERRQSIEALYAIVHRLRAFAAGQVA